jgi:hypothetical protein
VIGSHFSKSTSKAQFFKKREKK